MYNDQRIKTELEEQATQIKLYHENLTKQYKKLEKKIKAEQIKPSFNANKIMLL